MCSPGTIELKEMSEIIETLYEMEGVSKVRHCPTHQLQRIFFMTFFSNGNRIFFYLKVNAGEKAAMIFGDLDIDGNGNVDEDEFIK